MIDSDLQKAAWPMLRAAGEYRLDPNSGSKRWTFLKAKRAFEEACGGKPASDFLKAEGFTEEFLLS
jgi:hypothetical protein